MKKLTTLLTISLFLLMSLISSSQTDSKTVNAIVVEDMTGQINYGKITYKMEKSRYDGITRPVGTSFSFPYLDGCESGFFTGYSGGVTMEVNREINGKKYKYRIELPCKEAYFNP
jgi:hypothetical protein